MSLGLLLCAVGLFLAGGCVCALTSRRAALSNRLGAAMGFVGSIAAAVAGAVALATGRQESLRLPWSIPFGSFYLGIDSLSAFFVIAIGVVCALAAVYGAGYLKSSLGRRNVGASWLFFHWLAASMLLVVLARNGVLFLVAWELMSLASFFLVMFDHERPAVREAGWTYLVATHLGTAFLLAMFVLLARGGSGMDFGQLSAEARSGLGAVLFLLAVIGFGTKAGFMPMHVWLPEAHPAAPSHVSAVMSGVMIKTGIYGLLRAVTFLQGPPPEWWGWTLIGVGAVSGVGGVAFALAQRDLKRLLAYSSVENIGIICLGLGLWLLGTATGSTTLAVLGLLGALLHVWNHGIFKSLLFLGAGAVAHATGTLDIERLGGLLKRMKGTGLSFLVGSAAICGLPPLNGFASEFLIYAAAFSGIAAAGGSPQAAVAGPVAVAALALIGGLAAACFAKVFGIVFLGEPRTADAEAAHEPSASMRVPMAALALMCVIVGICGPLAVAAATPLVNQLAPAAAGDPSVAWAQSLLWRVSLAGGIVVVVIIALHLLRRALQTGRAVERAVTWDCGYIAPTARMQYTASSFASPIVILFRWFLRPRLHRRAPAGLFPSAAGFESRTDDVFRRFAYGPLFGAVARAVDRVRWLQQGRNQLYVLYIVLTLLVLLMWSLA